jgi:hypothetical protein
VVLVVFTVFSVEVALKGGPLGFVTLAAREPWALQLFLDLAISMFFVGSWIRRDAKARGLPWLPYLISLPFVGSIGALAYLVHRSVAARPEGTLASNG